MELNYSMIRTSITLPWYPVLNFVSCSSYFMALSIILLYATNYYTRALFYLIILVGT